MNRLKTLAPEERPRERMLRMGPHQVADTELLAVLLGTGRGRVEDALALAERVLAELDGTDGLAAAPMARLLKINGIGPVKATRIRAAFELSLRAGPVEPPEHPVDPFADLVERMRGQVAPSDLALLACSAAPDAETIPLALGEGLGPRTRPGALLVRLLGHGPGPWRVAVVRGGGPPTAAEREAGARLMAAAALVGVPVDAVLVVNRSTHWLVSDEAA